MPILSVCLYLHFHTAITLVCDIAAMLDRAVFGIFTFKAVFFFAGVEQGKSRVEIKAVNLLGFSSHADIVVGKPYVFHS